MSAEFAKGFAALTTSFCGRSIADGLNGQLGVAAQQAAEEGKRCKPSSNMDLW